jgi:hypothetical protein
MLAGVLLLLAACLQPTQYSRFSSWFPADKELQAFVHAAEFGQVEKVRSMMKAGFDPNQIFTNQGTPLIALPVIAKQPAVLKAMLEEGADPNVKRQYDTGDRGIRNRDNALVWAAKADTPEYLAILIDHGGDPNTRNSNDETLMMQARLWGDSWDNVKMLVQKGADVNGTSQTRTLAESYSGLGSFMKVHWLLEHGADLSADTRANKATLESIFWHPYSTTDSSWQKKCQQWALAHGYERPPLPDYYKEMRQRLGMPDKEADIPLL